MNHEIALPVVAVVLFSMEDGWEGKREVEALEVVDDAMEKDQMGIRTKNNWRKTILEPDNESGLKRTLPRALKGEDKQALWSVYTRQIKARSALSVHGSNIRERGHILQRRGLGLSLLFYRH